MVVTFFHDSAQGVFSCSHSDSKIMNLSREFTKQHIKGPLVVIQLTESIHIFLNNKTWSIEIYIKSIYKENQLTQQCNPFHTQNKDFMVLMNIYIITI